MKTDIFRAGAPPGKNDEAQAGQGLGFGVLQTNGLGLLKHYNVICEFLCTRENDSQVRRAEVVA